MVKSRSGRTRHPMLSQWFVVPAVLILLTVIVPSEHASAHANIVRSEPASGAVLETAPDVISVEFSEEVDPGATSLTLFNGDGDMLINGQGRVESATPRIVTLNLDRLPDGTYVLLPEGTYSAVWRAQSAVDGHVTNGSIGFSVGEQSAPASLLPPPGTPDPATDLPPLTNTLIRWLGFVSAALTAGSLMFGLLVWRPAFRRASGAEYSGADKRALSALRMLARTSIIALAVATLLSVLAQVLATPDRPLLDTISGRFGLLAGARLALLAVLTVVIARLPLPGSGKTGSWWIAVALAGGILLTFSLQSHSAALGVVPVTFDWLHMAAMSAWVGGLVPLVLLLRPVPDSQNLLAGGLVPRFSTLALAATAVLALTGLYNSLVHIGTVEALTDTSYGRALLVKVGLFALLILLGALNLLVLTPRLERNGSTRGFRRTIRAEIAIGLGVLVATAVLTAVSPASEALDAQRQLGLHETAQLVGLRLDLRVAPGQVGYNEFGVDIEDPRPGAASVEPQVLLRFTTLNHSTGSEHDMGTTQVEAKPEGDGRYAARGSYISMGGTWQVEVIVRRAGFDDVRHTFSLPTSTARAP